MNYQDEHNDFSDAGDYNAYSDDDINDYHFAKDDDSVDPSNYDDDDDGGRRSPTESLLIRRHHQRHNTTRHELRSPPQHGINRHRGETRESFYGVDDQQAFSPQPMASIRSSSSFPSPSKRGPSRSPSPANQAPPQSTRRATTLRSVSSPHLRKPSHSLLPDLRALPPSPRLESSSFNRYRESQIGSPSASSRNSSCSARDRVYGDRPTLLSPTSRRQYLPQATPGLLSSQSPRLRSHGSDSAPFSDPIAAESLDQRRRILRESHIATDSWYRLYESLEIGTLPLPEQCVDAPPSQRLLAKIPNLKSFRKTSALGHFYISHSDTEFRCQVEIDSEGLCGKIFKKSGGSKTRLNHVTNNHPELFDALREFRSYQCMVQAIELQPEPDELDIPSTPKRSRFETARDEFVINNMKQPLAFEEETFVNLILKLIYIRGAPFSLFDSDEFKALCGLLNPLYKVPSTETLQRRLDSRVRSQRQEIKAYIHQNVVRGSITADGWMAIDKRKFLGITFHFLTPTFALTSVVIGMERIVGPQTSDVLLNTLSTVLNNWGLDKKLIGGTTDQGANIKKTMLDLSAKMGIAWIPCSSHKIQLCINKALDRTHPAKALLEKCHDISTFFRNHSVGMTVLGKAQKSLRITTGDPLTLLSIVPTRWNSYFEMAQRVLKIWDAIPLAHNNMPSATSAEQSKRQELGRLLLTDNEVKSLRDVIRLLEPAAHFTHWAGGTSNPTISQVYPRVYSMLPALDSFTMTEARDLHGNLETLIQEAWPLDNIPDAILLTIYLNPASASLNMLDRAESLDKKKLRDKAKVLAAEALISFKLEEQAKLRRQQAGNDAEPGQEKDAGEEDIEQEPIDTANFTTRYFRLQAMFSVEAYDLQVTANPAKFAVYMEAPQTYWEKHSKDPEMKDLAQVARSYLSMQATSNESERLFSHGSRVMTPRKTRMNDHTFRNIIFASSYEKVLSVVA